MRGALIKLLITLLAALGVVLPGRLNSLLLPSLTPPPVGGPVPSPTPREEDTLIGFCLKVPILMYHHIQPTQQAKIKKQTAVDNTIFASQMAYLVQQGYTFISGAQLVQALTTKTKLTGKPVMITIDDGYADAYTYAYPTLTKYQVHAALMIPTGLLNNPDYLTWDQLRAMVNSGLVDAYDHTWSHYSLSRGSDAADNQEIMLAKSQLEIHLGREVNMFAYPYGSFDNRIVRLLQADGFAAAFSTRPGRWQCDTYLFGLKRLRVGNGPLAGYGL